MLRSVVLSCCFAATPAVVLAQLAPEIGYVHPAGAKAGTTIDLVLGGYDWTPDMQILVHDPRVKLELTGAPSGVLVPEPPYWFGLKARGYAWPLPREFPARLTVPADVAPGLVLFQVANANGISPVGALHIGAAPEVVEAMPENSPQVLPALPVTVSGQIKKIEEIDRYQFRVGKTGPVTIELTARQLKSPLHAMIKVSDSQGRVLVDFADTAGRDFVQTFAAQVDETYVLSIHDLDYAGDRSYVYRLSLSEGPRVVAAYPAAGKRGETRRVEFVLDHGHKVESVVQDIAFPLEPTQTPLTNLPFAVTFRGEAAAKGGAPAGKGKPAKNAKAVATIGANERASALSLSDFNERLETELTDGKLDVPGAVTGFLETRFGSDRYQATFKKGEKWVIRAEARAIGSPLDLDLAILNADGKQVAQIEDTPGTTDSELEFVAAADGNYQIVLTDRAGASGSKAANYRLVLEPVEEDFAITLPPLQTIVVGATSKVPLKATRIGGFSGPLSLQLSGLPPGVSVPADLIITEKKVDLSLDLTAAVDAPTTAAMVEVSAKASLNGQEVTRSLGKFALATILKPRIKIVPDGLDDVRKVHRGSTYLAPLTIERLDGFQGEIVLEMTAKQQRHRQGLASGEYVVKADAARVDYPIFVPEWMETTKTSRMILNGAVKVPDPQGHVRTLLQRQELRIGILPEGALLKLSHAVDEPVLKPGDELHIPLTISRAESLKEPVRLSLPANESGNRVFSAEPIVLTPDRRDAVFVVRLTADASLSGERTLVIRAESTKDGLPVISETAVLVMIRSIR